MKSIIDIDPKGKYSIGETSKMLGIHRSTLWRWCRVGKVKTYICLANNKPRIRGQDIIDLWSREVTNY